MYERIVLYYSSHEISHCEAWLETQRYLCTHVLQYLCFYAYHTVCAHKYRTVCVRAYRTVSMDCSEQEAYFVLKNPQQCECFRDVQSSLLISLNISQCWSIETDQTTILSRQFSSQRCENVASIRIHQLSGIEIKLKRIFLPKKKVKRTQLLIMIIRLLKIPPIHDILMNSHVHKRISRMCEFVRNAWWN